MPSYSARVLVLRKTKLGETDLIVTMLAEDGRQLRAVAKGVRKPGSRFGARLEPGAVCDLLLHTGRSLDVVTEAETVDPHAALREDYERSTAASVVLDFADKAAVEGQAEERMFPLAAATLDALEGVSGSATRLLAVAFLVKAMAVQGYRPQLSACVHCASRKGCDGFSLEAGGVVCAECGDLDPATLPLSREARGLLGRLLRSRMAEVASMPPSGAAVEEATRLVRAFVVHHLPARMRSLELLG